MFLPFPSISAANPSFVSTVNFQDSRPATWGSTVWEFLRVSDEQMSNQLGVEHFLFVCFGLFGGFHRKFVGFLSSIGCPWWAVPKSNLSHWRFVHLLLTSTLTRVFWSRCTLPETYISTLNIIGWKMIVSFRIAFRDELLVSRVIINTNCLIHLDSWVDFDFDIDFIWTKRTVTQYYPTSIDLTLSPLNIRNSLVSVRFTFEMHCIIDIFSNRLCNR